MKLKYIFLLGASAMSVLFYLRYVLLKFQEAVSAFAFSELTVCLLLFAMFILLVIRINCGIMGNTKARLPLYIASVATGALAVACCVTETVLAEYTSVPEYAGLGARWLTALAITALAASVKLKPPASAIAAAGVLAGVAALLVPQISFAAALVTEIILTLAQTADFGMGLTVLFVYSSHLIYMAIWLFFDAVMTVLAVKAIVRGRKCTPEYI